MASLQETEAVYNDFDPYDFAHLQSPPFPHTPSYNGSYQNSPYSNHSDLSYDPADFPLFDDDQQLDDYDPSEYDPPNSSALLMFDGPFALDHPHVSLSLTPAPIDRDHHSPFDYSSPSSNGGNDDNNQPRSRASSVSSSRNPNPLSSSPRLDMAHNFENLHFESPAWPPSQLPADRTMSPPRKPQSPPQLLIPDSASPSSRHLFPHSDPPIINAPDGDGGFVNSGPQLHIVPATPVSGGGATSHTVPFQNTLDTLHHASQSAQQPPSSWDHPPSDPASSLALSLQQQPQHRQTHLSLPHQRQSPQQPSPHAQLPYSLSQHSHSHDLGLSTSASQVPQQLALPANNVPSQDDPLNHHPRLSQNQYLFPQPPPRNRSKSDTSARPPAWNMSDNILPMNPIDLDLNTLDDSTLPDLSYSNQFSYPSSSNPSFLSPDLSANLRRSKSDSGGPRPGHSRLSRSEDISHSPSHLFPPSSQQEFINRQYLHPHHSLSLSQENVPSIRGHSRRASSGSRGGGLRGVGGEDGSWSGLSSNRASPYPSPNASPRVRYDELELTSVQLSGRNGGMHSSPLQNSTALANPAVGGGPANVQVTKQTVTSGRTADASHRRRKQDANFLCPVPGCGSTFTRSFNLKGHMRSHNEERPFQCKWPGCGKGFARQHDCKRHEQLHSNYRPFTCEGCSKTFARMDALNRHLRSEGGAECQRILDASRDPSGRGPVTKTEDGWPGMSVMV